MDILSTMKGYVASIAAKYPGYTFSVEPTMDGAEDGLMHEIPPRWDEDGRAVLVVMTWDESLVIEDMCEVLEMCLMSHAARSPKQSCIVRCPTRPLVVRGFYRARPDENVVHATASSDLGFLYRSASLPGITIIRGMPGGSSVSRVKWAELTSSERDRVIETLARHLRASNVAQAVLASRMARRTRCTYPPSGYYHNVGEVRRALGAAIRKYVSAYNGSATRGEVADLAERVEDAMRDAEAYIVVDGAIDAFNGVCHIEHEIGQCVDCHTSTIARDMYATNRGDVCSRCAEDYVEVEDGDGLYHTDDVYFWESDECYHREEEPEEEDEEEASYSVHIHDYSTNVLRYCEVDHTIKSSSYGDFLMGVELEVEAEDRPATAEHLSRQISGWAIMKYDGSLDDCKGIEIVTAPRGLADHIERFKALDVGDDVCAWDAGSCGMHVHIDSRAFTALTLGKFIEFINSEANDEFIRHIAGRHPHWSSQCRTYCQRERELVAANPKKNLAGKSTNRYRMVNTATLGDYEAHRLQVPWSDGYKAINTIELRVFRATLNKKRLLAQIEFAHAAVMFCRQASMQGLTQVEFLSWLREMVGVYPNLAKWFGVKQQQKAPTEPVKQLEEEEI